VVVAIFAAESTDERHHVLVTVCDHLRHPSFEVRFALRLAPVDPTGFIVLAVGVVVATLRV
ncbi:hypothetical protein OFO93_39875, partial [Escherichia coli]|nr:hypothetical protein [Escherichia coli]